MKTFILICLILILILCIFYIIYVFTFYNHCKNCGHVKGKVYTMTYTTKSDKWLTPDYDLCEKCYKKRN